SLAGGALRSGFGQYPGAAFGPDGARSGARALAPRRRRAGRAPAPAGSLRARRPPRARASSCRALRRGWLACSRAGARPHAELQPPHQPQQRKSMTLIQALITAILQGVTELFPVSSLGHAVVLPRLFGWNIDQHSPGFLPFVVVLHLGTAAALLLYFWRDWIGLALAVLFIGPREERRARQLLLVQIVVATIPVVILGF